MVDIQTPFSIRKRARAERSGRKRLQVRNRRQTHSKRRIKPYDIKAKNSPVQMKERAKRGKLMPEGLV
jgi:hypothetical protein